MKGMAWKTAGQLLLFLILLPSGVRAAEIGPFLARKLAAGDATVPVIIRLASQPQAQLQAVNRAVFHDRDARRRFRQRFIEQWRDRHDPDRDSVRAFLRDQGGRHLRHLWLINAFAAEVPAGVVNRLAALPAVARVELDRTLVRPPAPVPSAIPSRLAVQADH